MHPQFIESSITFVMAAMLAAHTMARADRSHSTRAVIGLMVSLMIWTGGVALSRVETDPAASYAWSCVAMAGAFLVPPAWLWMALSFTERLKLMGVGRMAGVIFAPTSVAILGLITNPLHHALIARPEMLLDHAATAWAGPIFWPWITWAYLLVVVGSALYVRASVRLMRTDVRGRAWLMVVGALLPLAMSVIHTLGLVETDYDRTPFVLGFSTLMLYVVDWRFRLLDTMPIARRDVIDQLRDGVVVADAEGLIVHMNGAAEKMWEVRLSDVAGQSIVRVVSAQAEGRMDLDEAEFVRMIRKMGELPTGFEATVDDYKGRVFEIRGSSVCDVEGDVAGIYMILRDRTAAHRYESMAGQVRRNEAVAGLAAGIAHEVNNPLAYVRANVTHLLGLWAKPGEGGSELDPRLDDDVREILDESLEGIDRIGTIVDRLQNLSTPLPSEPQPFDVGGTIREAVRTRGLHDSTEPVVVVDTGPVPIVVMGNRDALLQSIVEVLENAECAVAGREPGRIVVRVEDLGDAALVVVSDDGPGVPVDARERAFDPFYTTAASPADDPGAGLGLAMASKAVIGLGGSIKIGDSSLGGAQVSIRLPAARS